MPPHVALYVFTEFLDKVRPFRAGSHQAHLAPEDIDHFGEQEDPFDFDDDEVVPVVHRINGARRHGLTTAAAIVVCLSKFGLTSYRAIGNRRPP